MLAPPQPTRYDLCWTQWGIAVRIHPFFWLLALILAYSDRASLPQIVVTMLCIAFSILIHEFGHALTAKRYGARNLKVVLTGYGGIAMSTQHLNSRQRVWQIIWGPGAGLCLFVLLLLVVNTVGLNRMPPLVGGAVRTLMWINLYWSLLNLIPVQPLDGGQLMREWLARKYRQGADSRSFRISTWIAGGGAIFFLLTGWFVATIIFMYLAFMNYQMMQMSRFGPVYHEPRDPWQRDSDWWKR